MNATKRFVLRARALVTILSVMGALVVVIAPTAALATDPSHVTMDLQGCDATYGGGVTLPNGSGFFICPDAAYGNGNLGKGWNELDLVPFRIFLTATNAAPSTQTYTFAMALDAAKNSIPGFDVLSAPTLNTALSDASCSAPAYSGEQTNSPGLGGVGTTRYRDITLTQASSTTCVLDLYGRLALGSHSFPGASLHGDLANQGATSSTQDRSIPVNEIKAQSLSKNMTATQDSDHIWDVIKSPTPASLSFTNTCDPAGSLSQSVAITVTWTKHAASPSGDITVLTHVYATNPASRAIDTSVTDVIYSGTTALDTSSAGPTSVPANTANFLMLTHTFVVPATTTNLNDIATGTYADPVTHVAIPGTTTATASATVQSSGVENNASATITDVESITGTGLSYSVDSFTGASGSFDGGYVAGTPTTGNVSWTSTSQSSTGSVTFNKTVYATVATVDSTGGLSDTATLTGVDGFTTHDDLTVDVTTDATTSLSVSKSTTLKIATAQTFTFHLYDGTKTATGDTATVTIPANSNGPVSSSVITGLSPTGTYYFKEDATPPFAAQTTSPVTFALTSGDASTCSKAIDVTNSAGPATARVQKTTTPASSGLWTFTLTGPNGLSEPLNNVQAGAGYSSFAASLDVDGGTYTITETPQSGYDLTSVSGDIGGNAARVTTSTTSRTCSFVLNLTTDSDGVFSCSFGNTQEGTIIVKKATNPVGAPGSFTFTGDAAGSIGDGGTITVSNLVPGTYTSTESDPTPAFDLTGLSCNDGASATPSTVSLATRTATFKLDPGETITCTFTNTQRGTIIVRKVTDPTGSPGSFTFTGDAAGSIGDGGTITVNNLVPGTYTSTEANPTPAFDLTGLSCDDGLSSTVSTVSLATRTATFKLDPGETVTCTFTNRARGHVRVVKTVSGVAPTGSQAFTFQLRQGASASSAGTILETQTANAGNGGVLNFTTYLVPGTTYQLCEQMAPGWMTSLGPPFFSVYNPSGDNSVVCTDFTVTAGQLKIFNIDNQPPPGGLALTIGYWKNWSSCSGGKQKPVLDQTLLAAANAGHPITLGTLVLDPKVLGASTACQYAVNILNKTTINGKTKKASDPLFNMAAQLLAADLNVQAGAGTCASAVNAINAAHQLLSKYSFDGNGYTPKLTTADASLANSLATTLDKYNNNKLC